MKSYKMMAGTFLMAVLLLLMLSGCGNGQPTSDQPSNSLPFVSGSTGEEESSTIESIEPDTDFSLGPDDETIESPIEKMKSAVLQYPSQNETWEYNVFDCYVEITGYIGPEDSDAIIPSEIDGLPVWKIGDSSLENAKVRSIKLPDCLEKIGAFAFAGSQIENIIMPQELYSIGQRAFDGCSRLITIAIPKGVIGIAKETFNGCENLSEITLPESLTFIDESAFSNCKSLVTFSIPDNVTQIGAGAFMDCISLSSISVPAGVKKIGQAAFSNCSRLSQVILEEGLESIGDGAFYNCKGLESIVIPTSVTSIGTNEWHTPEFEGVADNFSLTLLNPDITIYARVFGRYEQDNKVICGYAGSTAAKYCADHNITFQLIG